jgi:hypothetical protein
MTVSAGFCLTVNSGHNCFKLGEISASRVHVSTSDKTATKRDFISKRQETILFIHDLFNDTVSSSDHSASNDKITG